MGSTDPNPDTATVPDWHGKFHLEPGTAGLWRIGPLVVLIRRGTHQLLVAHRQAGEVSSPHCEVILPVSEDLLSEFEADHGPDAVRSSFTFGKGDLGLSVTPHMADRPVVLRPEGSLFVLPSDEVTLFVSLPIWLRLTIGSPAITLMEVPIFRPSDTWFGPSTWEGELCYAGKVAPRTDVAELARLPFRCTTPIRIRNRADQSLQIDRIRIPAHQLALFRDSAGHFWTQRVDLVRERSDDLAVLRIGQGVPAEAGDTARITDPRQNAHQNVIVRAFESLMKYS